MNADTIREALGKISETMDENRDELIELDQMSGDGDLGISMSTGFRAAWESVKESAETDIGKLLMKAGQSFNEEAPSSLGTIISLGLMGMAKSLRGKEEADFQDFANALNAGVQRIMERTGSKPGEKTILDSLCPALEAIKSGVEDPKKALALAAQAAGEGAEATKEMVSVHGRAAYYGEKSVGLIDGGAEVGALIFRSLAQ